MDETASSQSTPRTAAEYRAERRKLLDEMGRMDERMELDREQYNHLRASNASTIARIDARLADMDARLNHLQRERERKVATLDRDIAAGKRENLLLRLENAMLRFERRLPPGTPPADPPEE